MPAVTYLWNNLSLKRQLWALCILVLAAGPDGVGVTGDARARAGSTSH